MCDRAPSTNCACMLEINIMRTKLFWRGAKSLFFFLGFYLSNKVTPTGYCLCKFPGYSVDRKPSNLTVLQSESNYCCFLGIRANSGAGESHRQPNNNTHSWISQGPWSRLPIKIKLGPALHHCE